MPRLSNAFFCCQNILNFYGNRYQFEVVDVAYSPREDQFWIVIKLLKENFITLFKYSEINKIEVKTDEIISSIANYRHNLWC